MKIGDQPILHVKCQDTKWPLLSATSDVILLSFVAVHLISYKAEPDCLLKDMDVGLLHVSASPICLCWELQVIKKEFDYFSPVRVLDPPADQR